VSVLVVGLSEDSYGAAIWAINRAVPVNPVTHSSLLHFCKPLGSPRVVTAWEAAVRVGDDDSRAMSVTQWTVRRDLPLRTRTNSPTKARRGR